jgi:hypothetical protein
MSGEEVSSSSGDTPVTLPAGNTASSDSGSTDSASGEHRASATGHRAKVASINEPVKRQLSIEELAKLATAMLVLCYGVGLLVVNAYLLNYGASDFNLFRARFILSGLLVLSIVSISTIFPIVFFYFIRSFIQGPKRFSRQSAAIDVLMAWDLLIVSLMALSAPFWLFKLLHQDNFSSMKGYWLCGVAGGLALYAYYIGATNRKNNSSQKARDRQKAAKRPQRRSALKKPSSLSKFRPPTWTLYSLIGAFFLPYVFLVITYLTQNILPGVPSQLGGTEAQAVQLSIKSDSVPSLRTLGIPFINKSSGITREMDLLFTGENFYVVESNTDTFVLSADDVNGIKPSTSP